MENTRTFIVTVKDKGDIMIGAYIESMAEDVVEGMFYPEEITILKVKMVKFVKPKSKRK